MISVFLVFQFLGLFSSINAILEARTPQGAVAWVIGLNAISIIAVPALYS